MCSARMLFASPLRLQRDLLPKIEENEPINLMKVPTDIEVVENAIKVREKFWKRPSTIWIGDSVEL